MSTFHTMGATLAGVVIGAGIPLIAYDTVEGNSVLNGGRFTLIAGVFSIGAVICYLLCYSLTTERVRPEIDPNAPKSTVSHMLRSIVTNRALVSIIAAAILMLLAQLTLTGMANYIFPNYYSAPDVQSLSSLLTMALTFVIAAVAKPIAVKVGKREMSIIASFISVAGLVGAFVVRPQNVWVFVAFYMVSYLGIAMFSMFCWALITNVIALKKKHGEL